MTAPANQPPMSPPSPEPSTWRRILYELRTLSPRQWLEVAAYSCPPLLAMLVVDALLFSVPKPRSYAWPVLAFNVGAVLVLIASMVEEAQRVHAASDDPRRRGTRWLLAVLNLSGVSVAFPALTVGLLLGTPYENTLLLNALVGLSALLSALAFRRMRTGTGTLRAAIAVDAKREVAAQVEALTARNDALQALTDPHFLFNTLNTLAARVRHDPKIAEDLPEDFATIMRRTLSGPVSSVATVAEELAFVRAYLGIQQARFPERLTVRWEIDKGVGDYEVPPFVLQPLVENAIKHGFSQRLAPGTMIVSVRVRKGRLRLTVEDDGNGFPSSPQTGNGLENLFTRITLFAGRSGELRVEPLEPGARVIVDLPAMRRGE